jgi:hypothetical protein
VRTATRATKSANKIPTGLAADWKKKVSKFTGDIQTHQRASSPLGGLSDDDAHAERPDTIEIGNHYKNIGIVNRYKTYKKEVCQIYFGPDKKPLILSAGMKILVDDSDPDFIEYVKPKPKVKVGMSSVYIYK